jgi:hypothetical protein
MAQPGDSKRRDSTLRIFRPHEHYIGWPHFETPLAEGRLFSRQ